MCKEKPKNLVNDAVKWQGFDSFKQQMLEFTENMNTKMESLRTEVNRLKFKVDPLLTSENVVDELRNDKLNLMKENPELRENVSLTTSDLKTKVKDLEHERDSLITALNLQQQDIEQNRTTTQKRLAEWKTTSAPKNKDNQASATLNLHNSFDTLVDEVGEENGEQHPSVINLDISQQSDPDQQPTEENNTSTGSNNGGTLTGHITNRRNQNKEKSQEAKQSIVIGDSIVKHIIPAKLSKKKVHKFTYPGKTASEINNKLNTIEPNLTPSHVVVHAGTNNIPSQSVDEFINDIEELIVGVKEKFPNSKIGISSITTRQDIDSTSKVNEFNDKIKAISQKHSVKFIDKSSLDETSLNSSKHLNSKGTAILATHFINFIKGGKPSSQLRNRSRRDFQTGTINQLEELLKLISRLNRHPTN